MNISKISCGYNNLAFKRLNWFKNTNRENNKEVKSMEEEANNLSNKLNKDKYYSIVIPSHEIEYRNSDGTISVDYVKINNIIKDKLGN